MWVALLLALAGCSSVVHRQSPTPHTVSVTAAAAKVSLRTKQFSAALRELQAGAEHGDVQSEYLLGLVYAMVLAPTYRVRTQNDGCAPLHRTPTRTLRTRWRAYLRKGLGRTARTRAAG